VWATLWGLLMWNALFADVADSLRTPFQTSPLDLSTPSFYKVLYLTIPPLADSFFSSMAQGPVTLGARSTEVLAISTLRLILASS
jgi:hypothetical protein